MLGRGMQINKKIRESNFTDNQSTLYIALIPPDRNTAAREMGSQYMLLPAHCLLHWLCMNLATNLAQIGFISPAARSQKAGQARTYKANVLINNKIASIVEKQ